MQGRENCVNEARPNWLGYERFTEAASKVSSGKVSFFLGIVPMKAMVYSSRIEVLL